MPRNFRPLPIDELREQLNYDPLTGDLTYRKANRNGKCRPGRIAGSADANGYLNVRLRGVTYKAHRVCWALGHGADPGEKIVDHENGIKTDNRLTNLRISTEEGNNQNARLRHDSTSGVKGVSWNAGIEKWAAQITVDRKRITLGYFNDLSEAAGRVALARMRLHGEFGRHK